MDSIVQQALQGFLCGPDFVQCVSDVIDGLQDPQAMPSSFYPRTALADFGGAGTEHLYDQAPGDQLTSGGLTLRLDESRKQGELRVSYLDFHASDVSGFLATIKPGDYIRVFSRLDPVVFTIAKVVSASRVDKEYVFGLEVATANQYFLDGDRVALTLSPAGPSNVTAGAADVKGPSLADSEGTIFSSLNMGMTSGDARVSHVLAAVITQTSQRIPVPEELRHVCVPGSILPIGFAPAKPVAVGLRVEDDELVIEVDQAQLEYYEQVPIVVQLSGLAVSS